METEDCVSRVICSIPAREFTIFSDEGKVTKVTCDTPEEFQNVLKDDGTPFKVFTPFWKNAEKRYLAVSYTHLTLPTIYSV